MASLSSLDHVSTPPLTTRPLDGTTTAPDCAQSAVFQESAFPGDESLLAPMQRLYASLSNSTFGPEQIYMDGCVQAEPAAATGACSSGGAFEHPVQPQYETPASSQSQATSPSLAQHPFWASQGQATSPIPG